MRHPILSKCYERPIPMHLWTEERGNEQLRRISACYHREHVADARFVAITLLLAVVMLALLLVLF
jgi:hypothetical protein